MKKLLSVLLVLAMAVSCIAVVQMTTLAASEETILNVDFEDSSAEGYNHNSIFNNTCGVVVEHAKDGENNVLQFTTSLSWEAPMWYLGNKVKAFADANPGKDILVTASVDVKGDGAAKKARLSFRHKDADQMFLSTDVDTEGTWKTIGGSVLVEADTAAAATNDSFWLVLDNLGLPYPNNNNVTGTVQMDNIKVTVKTVEKPIGYEYTITQTSDAWDGYFIYNSAWNSDLSFLKSEVKDGKVTLNYTVYNMSDVDIQFQPMIQVGWKFIKNDGAKANPKYNVKAKTSAKITFTFDMSADGKVTNVDGVAIDLTSATLRFDYLDGEGNKGVLPVGTKFAIIPDNEKLVEYMSVLSGVTVEGTSISEAPVLPTPGEDATPTPGGEATPTPGEDATPTPGEEATPTPTPKKATGVKVTFNDDVTFADPKAMYFNTDTNGGVTSVADIKNNQITKTFKIKNHGEETIGVVVRLQATVKQSDGVTDTWAGNPDTNDMVEIEPGKVGTVTITVPVKDGKVTILEQEVPVEKLFARFDVTGEGGACELPKGTSFTIFCDEQVAETMTKSGVSNSDKLTRELSYESLDSNSSSNGDLLPVAFIAVAVVATAALVVVSRKKREEF